MAKKRNLDPIWRTNRQNRDTLMILILSKVDLCPSNVWGTNSEEWDPNWCCRSNRCLQKHQRPFYCQHVETSFDLHMHNLLRHKSGFKTHIVLWKQGIHRLQGGNYWTPHRILFALGKKIKSLRLLSLTNDLWLESQPAHIKRKWSVLQIANVPPSAWILPDAWASKHPTVPPFNVWTKSATQRRSIVFINVHGGHKWY